MCVDVQVPCRRNLCTRSASMAVFGVFRRPCGAVVCCRALVGASGYTTDLGILYPRSEISTPQPITSYFGPASFDAKNGALIGRFAYRRRRQARP